MPLIPCENCRRHFELEAERCPHCRAQVRADWRAQQAAALAGALEPAPRPVPGVRAPAGDDARHRIDMLQPRAVPIAVAYGPPPSVLRRRAMARAVLAAVALAVAGALALWFLAR